jgi:hypothetical protein
LGILLKLLMPVQSKVAEQSVFTAFQQLLLGSNRRKMVSATILLIVAFLIHIRNKKPEGDPLKNSKSAQSEAHKKKVFVTSRREEKDM